MIFKSHIVKKNPLWRRAHCEKLEPRNLLAMIPGLAYEFDQARPDGFAVRRDEPGYVALDVRANDSLIFQDWQAGKVSTIEISVPPLHGSARISDDGLSILYQPQAGFSGIDSFTYRYVGQEFEEANRPIDPNGSDPNRNESSAAKVHVLVTEPWLAVGDWYHVRSGETSSFDVLANDRHNARFTHGEDWKLQLVEAESIAGATVALGSDGSRIVYTAKPGFLGVDSVRYVAVDADGYQVVGEAKVRVTTESETSNLWPEQIEQKLVEKAVAGRDFGAFIMHGYWYWASHGLGDIPVATQISTTTVSSDLSGQTGPSAGLPRNHDFEGTNNQIAGIEEADRVKSDGEYLYVLSAPKQDEWFRWGGIAIVDLWFNQPFEPNAPAEPSLLTVIDIRQPDRPTVVSRQIIEDRVLAQDLSGDRLTVIADRGGKTVVSIFDVSSPENLQLISSTLYSGRYEMARRVEDRLLVVTKEEDLQPPPLQAIDMETPPENQPADSVPSGFWETGQQYLARVTDSLAEFMLPRQQVLGGSEAETTITTLTGFEETRWDVLFPPNEFGYYLAPTSLISIDTSSDTGGAVDWDLAQPYAQILVTQEAVYTVSPEFDATSWWGSTSAIEQFTWDSGQLAWTAAGEVPGSLLNTFSMDAFEGTFRLTTTQFTGNNLYVLERQGDKLVQIGALENLAPDEQIYATRFAGEKAFVVTFRLVDPLFVIDLSDPTRPLLQGELKIPGYSQYLQVIGNDHVLSVGRDADPETGLYEGLVISLFNVSDPENPFLQDRFTFEGGRSTFSPFAAGDARNLLDHHAIRYFAGSQILALPAYSLPSFWEDPANHLFDDQDASGMFTFRIDATDGIVPVDRIDFDSRVDRAVRVGPYLYSLSAAELKVSLLDTPDSVVAALKFRERGTDDFSEARFGKPVVVDVLENDGSLAPQAVRPKILRAEIVSGTGTVEIVDDGTRISYTPGWKQLGNHQIRYVAEGEGGETVEAFMSVRGRWNWHNVNQLQDVDGDGNVTPQDALLGINFLNRWGTLDTEAIESLFAAENFGEEHFAHLDVNGDNLVSPLDALVVINWLNDQAEQRALAEPTLLPMPTPTPFSGLAEEDRDRDEWFNRPE